MFSRRIANESSAVEIIVEMVVEAFLVTSTNPHEIRRTVDFSLLANKLSTVTLAQLTAGP